MTETVLCVMGHHQYGDPLRGVGVEFDAFVPALRRLGYNVVVFESHNRNLYRDLAELNLSLIRCFQKTQPKIVLSVQFEDEIWTETLDYLRASSGAKFINWMTDDSFKFKWFSRFLAPHFDLVATTYPPAVDWYRKKGINNVLLSQWASSTNLCTPLPARKCKYPVSFVGAAYGERQERVSKLRGKGLDVHCFGHGWENGPVSSMEMQRIFRESMVSLNFSAASWRYPLSFKASLPQLKARVFDVPGAGGMLVTDPSPGIERYYRVGEEIVVADGESDIGSQVRYLLDNPSLRDRIAIAGHARTSKDHTYEHRLEAIFDAALATDTFVGQNEGASVYSRFKRALRSHQCGHAERTMRGLVIRLCRLRWHGERGTRAARRLIHEFDWRLRGERAYSAHGWAGRMFPTFDLDGSSY